MPDYQLNDADRQEVERRVAIDQAVQERMAEIGKARSDDAEKASREAIDRHNRTEAARFALEPPPGSLEAFAREHALRQQKIADESGPLFRYLLPDFVKNVQPPPTAIPS